MDRMSIVVINVDHLPPFLLGVYGNSVLPTPAVDSFAGQAFLLEFAMCRGEVKSIRAYDRKSWFEKFHNSDSATLWLTWEASPDSSDTKLDSDLHRTIRLPMLAPAQCVEEWTQSSLAGYVESVIAALESEVEDHFGLDASNTNIWIDLPLMSVTWDAPLKWRQYLSGEDDPEIITDTVPPSFRLVQVDESGPHNESLVLRNDDASIGFDPDQLLGFEQACGAQVMLLDHCFEKLLSRIESTGWGGLATIVLTAESGFALGEHQQIGWSEDSLQIEQAQVPFLVRPSGYLDYPIRVPGLQAKSEWLDFVAVQELTSFHDGVKDDEQWLEASGQQFSWQDYSLFGHDFEEAVPVVRASVDALPNPYHSESSGVEPFGKDGSVVDEVVVAGSSNISSMPTSAEVSAEVSAALPPPRRTAVLTWSEDQVAVRTNSWGFLWRRDDQVQLYVRPDDRFEQNNAADRRQRLVEQFQLRMLDFFAVLAPQAVVPDWLASHIHAVERSVDSGTMAGEEVRVTKDIAKTLEQLPVDFWISAR